MYPNPPFTHYAPSFVQAIQTPRGRGRGAPSTGAKRGRKPRGSFPNVGVDPRPLSQPIGPSTSQLTTVQWAQPITNLPNSGGQPDPRRTQTGGDQSQGSVEAQSQGSVLSLPGAHPVGAVPRPGGLAADEDGDGEDDHELLPAMADDDFAAQSSWNSQSKDNLKYTVLCHISSH